MRRSIPLFCLAAVAAASLVATPAAHAGVDINFGINAPVGDDGNLFFSISSHYFDREPQVVTTWAHRFPNPDDLAVFLHICSQTRVAPEVVFGYRNHGMSWYDVGARCGIPVSTWYVPVERAPGPPYGHAYGHWEKYQHDPHHAVKLSDREARDLVAVRMAHEYYGVSPETAMDWRRHGGDVRTMMTREYRTRHHDEGREREASHGNHQGNEDHDGRHDDHHGRDHDDKHADRHGEGRGN
jgi:hypothetical protein